MSFDIKFRAATPAEAKAKLTKKIEKMLMTAPIHAHDCAAAEEAAMSYLNLLDHDGFDPARHNVDVAFHGSVSARNGNVLGAKLVLSVQTVAAEAGD